MDKHRKFNNWATFFVWTSFALLAPGWFSTSIFAQSSRQDMPGIIRAETEQGFAYMTGGVGSSERELMERRAQDYNLKLAFAETSGVYLSDVELLIAKDGREMVRATSNGPWFYIELPPGGYTVKATYEDETKQIKNLQLAEGRRVTRLLHWDLEEET